MASVRKLKTGSYQAQYRPFPGGKQITHTTRRKVDAQRWLDEQQAALVTGQYVDPSAGKITFKNYFEQWAVRQVWVPGTDRAMRLAAEGVTFADVPMKSLRRSHVETWVKSMMTADRGDGRPEGLAPGTIRTRFNNMRAVLRAATKERIIVSDPSEGVRLPRGRRATAAMRLPTPHQVGDLLTNADPGFKTFVALCAFGGLRLGEAAALKIGDVDFADRTLSVSRQVQRVDAKKVEIRAPKYGSERSVYLADQLVTMLADHIASLPSSTPDTWLFEGERGNPLHQNSVGYWWRRARERAGCETVRMHDLRHFYASGLIAAGCDVVTVQRALGHASANVTLSTYAHLWPSAEDRTRNAASSMLADVLGQPDEPLTNGE